MKKIPFHIRDIVSGKTFKCNIIESTSGWQCILYQEFFRFQFINESSLEQCMETLAQYLEPMQNVMICSENEFDAIYVAILEGHIRILRSKRLMDRLHHG